MSVMKSMRTHCPCYLYWHNSLFPRAVLQYCDCYPQQYCCTIDAITMTYEHEKVPLSNESENVTPSQKIESVSYNGYLDCDSVIYPV